jgi:hypothetical protein
MCCVQQRGMYLAQSMPTKTGEWGQRLPSTRSHGTTHKTWNRGTNVSTSLGLGSARTAARPQSGRADAAWDDAPARSTGARAWKDSFASAPARTTVARESTSAPGSRRTIPSLPATTRSGQAGADSVISKGPSRSAVAPTPDLGPAAETWEERALPEVAESWESCTLLDTPAGHVEVEHTSVGLERARSSSKADSQTATAVGRDHPGMSSGSGDRIARKNDAASNIVAPLTKDPSGLPLQSATSTPAPSQPPSISEPAAQNPEGTGREVQNLPASPSKGPASKSTESQEGQRSRTPSAEVGPPGGTAGTDERHACAGGDQTVPSGKDPVHPVPPVAERPNWSRKPPLRVSSGVQMEVQGSSPRAAHVMPVVGFDVVQPSSAGLQKLDAGLGTRSGRSTPAGIDQALSRETSRNPSEDSEVLDVAAFGRSPVPLRSGIRCVDALVPVSNPLFVLPLPGASWGWGAQNRSWGIWRRGYASCAAKSVSMNLGLHVCLVLCKFSC